MSEARLDLLGAFLAGVAALAVLCYLFWRAAGQPPPNP